MRVQNFHAPLTNSSPYFYDVLVQVTKLRHSYVADNQAIIELYSAHFCGINWL